MNDRNTDTPMNALHRHHEGELPADLRAAEVAVHRAALEDRAGPDSGFEARIAAMSFPLLRQSMPADLRAIERGLDELGAAERAAADSGLAEHVAQASADRLIAAGAAGTNARNAPSLTLKTPNRLAQPWWLGRGARIAAVIVTAASVMVTVIATRSAQNAKAQRELAAQTLAQNIAQSINDFFTIASDSDASDSSDYDPYQLEEYLSTGTGAEGSS